MLVGKEKENALLTEDLSDLQTQEGPHSGINRHQVHVSLPLDIRIPACLPVEYEPGNPIPLATARTVAVTFGKQVI